MYPNSCTTLCVKGYSNMFRLVSVAILRKNVIYKVMYSYNITSFVSGKMYITACIIKISMSK